MQTFARIFAYKYLSIKKAPFGANSKMAGRILPLHPVVAHPSQAEALAWASRLVAVGLLAVC